MTGSRVSDWRGGAAEVDWNDLPDELQAKVRSHVLDTLGVMCAGLETPHGRAVQQVVYGWGGAAESTVVGRGWRLPAPAAAALVFLRACRDIAALKDFKTLARS